MERVKVAWGLGGTGLALLGVAVAVSGHPAGRWQGAAEWVATTAAGNLLVWAVLIPGCHQGEDVMERPTCKTCPYLYGFDADQGLCQRHAPRPVVSPAGPQDAEIGWPLIDSIAVNFCGEHPDFPAYIAGRSRPPEPQPWRRGKT